MWDGNINDIEQVVIYINKELSKGRTQKDIEINDFKVNERVIAKRLVGRGYKKINNQYVLKGYDNSNTKVITSKVNKCDSSNTEVIIEKTKEYEESNTLVLQNKKIQKNLIGLAKNYEKIMRMIEEYDKEYDKEYDGITVELPIETIKDFRTSIRVNNVVWEQFNEFANKNKEFTKRDLLSMALKEYMEKYK